MILLNGIPSLWVFAEKKTDKYTDYRDDRWLSSAFGGLAWNTDIWPLNETNQTAAFSDHQDSSRELIPPYLQIYHRSKKKKKNVLSASNNFKCFWRRSSTAALMGSLPGRRGGWKQTAQKAEATKSCRWVSEIGEATRCTEATWSAFVVGMSGANLGLFERSSTVSDERGPSNSKAEGSNVVALVLRLEASADSFHPTVIQSRTCRVCSELRANGNF